MRDILFRGKRVDNGEWVYGSLVHSTKYYGETTDKWFILHGGEFDCDYYDAEEVLPETIGQYTGMKDKNGKKIFEADIVLKRTYNGKKPFPVTFDSGMFHCGYGGGSSTATHGYTLDDRQIEIIGNVFDNPSMLKDKGEG